MTADAQSTPGRRKTAGEKNAEVRASLEPLAPGERPRAVTVAAIAAAVLAVGNVVAYFAGAKPENAESANVAVQLLLATGILAVCAIGMWKAKYWAVLGFQTLLALQMLVSVLALLRANNLAAVAVWSVLLAGAGVLFWFLIRAMARIQMPKPPETAALREAREKLEAARAAAQPGQKGDVDE
jgi:membrane-associated HD superfamily phosphohydrolase